MIKASTERIVRTACTVGDGVCCGLLAHVKDGVLIKVEPADFPDRRFRHICARGLCSVKLVYHPDRLMYPLKRTGKRGEGKCQRISWDEALDTVARNLTAIGEKYGYESIGFATGANSALILIYLRLASALQATWVNIIGFGDAAGPCGEMTSYGVLNGDQHLTDFEHPEMCVLWGANLVETHSLKWRTIRDARERGAKVVVIDPRFTPTASKADEYISIRPGTDGALALGLMNVILEEGLVDQQFVIDHTVGPFLVRSDNGLFLRERDLVPEGSDKYIIWDNATNKPIAFNEQRARPSLVGTYHINDVECKPAFQLLADLVTRYPPHKAAEITEVPPEIIHRLATDYVTLKPTSSYRGGGLQRTFHGDLSCRAISTLAAISGNTKPEEPRSFRLRQGAFIRVKNQYFKPMSLLQMYEAIQNSQPYQVKALWLAEHNLMNQDVDNNRVLNELVPRLDFIVAADMFMTASARYADIVLPVCSFYEHLDLVPPLQGPNKYLQLSQKVIEPVGESKPDVDIVNELAERMGLGEHFSMSAEQYIDLLISSKHPSMAGVTRERLKEGPVELPKYDVSTFSTGSGRFEFYSERMKPYGQELPLYIEPIESSRRPLAKRYPLSYLSTHTKYGNHAVFANESWLRELDPEPMLEMNPADAKQRGIKNGDMVKAFNDRGSVKLKVKIHQGIRPGVVNINQGWLHNQYAAGTHQALTHGVINPAQAAVFEPNSALYDNLVEVMREG